MDVAESLLVVGVMLNAIKGADLLLRDGQKRAIQSGMETVTLFVDHLRPLRWFEALARPTWSFLWSGLSAVFFWLSFLTLPASVGCLGGALALLFDFFTMSARNLELGRFLALSLLVAGLAMSVAGAWKIGPRIVALLVGPGRFWPFLGRLFLFYLVSALGFAMFWGLTHMASSAELVRWALIVFWPLHLPVVTWNTAGLLLVSLMMFLGVLELTLKLLRGFCWRIVEYNKGAAAAIVLVATIALGIYQVALKSI